MLLFIEPISQKTFVVSGSMVDLAFDEMMADGIAVVAKLAALANAKCMAGVICIVADVVGIMDVAEIVFVV